MDDAHAPMNIGAAVERAVLHKYAALSKNGKPQAHEYTLLAGFAVTCDDDDNDDEETQIPVPRVVALGTGTKCLSACARCRRGEALADSHAEVVARRALLSFLYDELHRLAARTTSTTAATTTTATPGHRHDTIFEWSNPSSSTRVHLLGADSSADDAPQHHDHDHHHRQQSRQEEQRYRYHSHQPMCRLRPGVKIHMYMTQSPCGDASIFSGGGGEDGEREVGSEGRIGGGGARVDGEGKGERGGGEVPRPVLKRVKTMGTSGGGAGSTGAKLLLPAGRGGGDSGGVGDGGECGEGGHLNVNAGAVAGAGGVTNGISERDDSRGSRGSHFTDATTTAAAAADPEYGVTEQERGGVVQAE